MTELSSASCLALAKMFVEFIPTSGHSNFESIQTWDTAESDKLVRCYWMCVLLESGPTGELGLARTGIADLQDSIPLPSFLIMAEGVEKLSFEVFIEHHFLAQITLRTLLNRVKDMLRSQRNTFTTDGRSISILPEALITELFRQLQAWRHHLPPALRWHDDDAVEMLLQDALPGDGELGNNSIYQLPNPTMLLNSSLQTRYKYVMYLIYRPYIYKALHEPDTITTEDLEGCKKALWACASWPLLLPVFQSRKRLIPHLYEYSHIYSSVLILLHVCSLSRPLRALLRSKDFSTVIEQSKSDFLLWLRDMQVVHPVAAWCWRLVQVLYKEHPVVKE